MKTECYPAIGDYVMLATPSAIEYDGRCGTVSRITKLQTWPIRVQLEDGLELYCKRNAIVQIAPSINIDDNIRQQLDKLYNQ